VLELEQRSGRVRAGSAPALGHAERLAFGGVAFELLSSVRLAREPEVERYCLAPSAHPVIADVLCAVTVDPALFADSEPYGHLEVERTGEEELVLRAPRVVASLRKVGPARYACSVRIAPHPGAFSELTRSVSAAIVQAEGGVIVHAAGIALDGRAVVFTGPSGTGKSTAATLTEGAAMFAYDHVALVAHEGRVLAYGLPGGRAARMAQTDDVVLPLACVLRIQRGEGTPHGQLLHGARALFTLREAVESSNDALPDEQARLHSVSTLAAHVPIGVLHTVLGMPLAAIVRKLCEART
jgi:hypothetical protein